MQKRMQKSTGHLDQTSLVNKGFIIWKKNATFLWEKHYFARLGS